MPTVQEVQGWQGRTLVDADGDKIGKIEDIYLDRQSGDPEWVAVKTGLFGTRVSFVPIRDATATGDDVRVAHTKDKVKDAPNIEADGELSPDEERALYEHYGREDYGDWTDESADRSERTMGREARGGDGERATGGAGTTGEGGTTGERGTTGDAGTTGEGGTTGERGTTGDAGTTGERGTAGEAGTAATATAGMAAAGAAAGTEGRGTRDTEGGTREAEGGTGTAAGTTGTGTAGTAGDDRDAEGYSPESEGAGREGAGGEGVSGADREGAGGQGVSGTRREGAGAEGVSGREGLAGAPDTTAGETGDDAMTRSEEELAVGTERREAGRARLRKYVVTEDVKETVPVQREELRVEREPITDDNVEQATQSPDISEAEHEITLHAEEPVAEKQAVPKERVRLAKDVQSDEQTVSDQVRKERIEPEGDARERQ